MYAHGKQYNNVKELEASIYKEWDEIPLETLQNLNESMSKRLFDVVLAHGGYTNENK